MQRTFVLGAVAVAMLALTGCSKGPEATAKELQEHLQRGDAFAAQKKFAEANVEYRNAAALAPRNGEVRFKLAESYGELRQTANAFREFIRAADLLPNDPKVQLRAGNLLLLAGRFEDAQSRAQRVLERQPRNVEALLLNANALARLKKLDDALAGVEEAISIEPERASLYRALAGVQMLRGERDDALASYRKAVEVDPKSVPARLAMAHFWASDGKLVEAEQELKAALQADPQNTTANRALAELYLVTGRVALAEPLIKTAAGAAKGGDGAIMLGDFYLRTRRQQEAKAQYEAVTPEMGRNFVVARVRLAAIARAAGDSVTALDQVAKGLSKAPNDASALALRSSLLREKGDVAGAMSAAKEAVTANPNSASAQFALGRAHEASREVDLAIAAFQRAAQLDANFVDVDLELAGLYLETGQVDAADTWAQSALKKAPESIPALLAVSSVSLAKRDVQAAEPVIRRLTARLPRDPRVLNKVGQLELLKRNRAGAQAAYEKVLETDASNTEALAGFVGIQLQAKRYDLVKSRINAAVQKSPKDGQLLVISARAHAVMQDYARAEQLLRSAIEVSPDLMDGYSLLARILVVEGKADTALKEMEALAARKPDLPGPHLMAGFIYGIQQKKSEAKAAYRRALDIDPKTPIAANNLAYLMADDGENLDEALELAQLAKQMMPKASDVSDTLGWVYYKRGLYGPAVDALREARERAPNDVTIQYHLGLALHRSGQTDEGRKLLEGALKASPAASEAEAARNAIASSARGGAR